MGFGGGGGTPDVPAVAPVPKQEVEKPVTEAATAARIYRAIKGQVPGIIDVSCKPTVMNTVIKLRKQYEGHAQHALLAAMGAHLDYNKLCMVVDEDVEVVAVDAGDHGAGMLQLHHGRVHRSSWPGVQTSAVVQSQ